MSGVDQAIKEITRATARAVGRVTPFRATVTGGSAGLVEIQRVDASTPDTRQYARVRGFALTNGDVVLCANLDGEPVVLGKVQISSPADFTLTAPLIVPSINTPFARTDAQSASDTASTTSTATYSDAMTTAVTLPTGTWTVHAVGGLAMKHSADTNVRMAIEINGTEGTARTLACPAATFRMVVDNGSVGSISGGGSINVKVRFRSSDAGTTSASNPWLMIVAERTA